MTHKNPPVGFDFSGYATRYDVRCRDGRTIKPGAFAHFDGKQVPMLWHHGHHSPENVLGHGILEARPDGLYMYGFFNGTKPAQHAATLVSKKNVNSLSIFANDLVEVDKVVSHGTVREVSLVLSGANEQARIEYVNMEHDGYDDPTDAVIFIGGKLETPAKQLAHSDTMTVGDVLETFSELENAALAATIDFATTGKLASQVDEEPDPNSPSMDEILDGMTDEKRNVFNYLVGESVDDDLEHDAFEAGDHMKRNIFEPQDEYEEEFDNFMSHDALNDALAEARDGKSSLAETVISHAKAYGVDEPTILFPDGYTNVNGAPEFIERDRAWVGSFLGKAKYLPFSRIKTVHADITADEARARGYVTGDEKVAEVIKLMKRTTDPTTIYKKQEMDRDDMIDITDFATAVWLKAEMREMLKEELGRACLVGDGRDPADAHKIDEDRIRPIMTDADMYSHKVTLANGLAITAVIDAVAGSMQFYKGAGSPTFFTTESFLSEMFTLRDADGRRMYSSLGQLAGELRVSNIVTVDILDGVQRDVNGDGSVMNELLGIVVNPSDYAIGSDKGGKTTFFDDFDIDFNKLKYLYESRQSGALRRYKSALVIEMLTA